MQEKAISEVDEIFLEHGEDLCGNDVKKLKYLDMVVQETTRLFPVLPPTRVCTKDWRIPDSDVVIPRGMKVIMSMGKETSYPKTCCACFSNELACIFQKMQRIRPILKIQKNFTQIDGAEKKSKTCPLDWY